MWSKNGRFLTRIKVIAARSGDRPQPPKKAVLEQGVGAYVGAAIGGLPGFVVGVGVGVGLGAFWEFAIKSTVFWIATSSGFDDPYQEIRHLQPLGGA